MRKVEGMRARAVGGRGIGGEEGEGLFRSGRRG